jgi:MFS family permease
MIRSGDSDSLFPAEPSSRPDPEPPGRLSPQESRSVSALCAIYSLRMVGLYIVLPVLSPYANTLSGATSLLIGIALGAYGLTQAVFQIPFGYLSDRIGRKLAILLGLIIFVVGSCVAATAGTILVLIAGRLLQGMGAVASTVAALAADLTRPEVRTQAMARLGVWIGGSFAFGMMVGPFAAGLFGVPSLFWATAVLSTIGAAYLMVGIPRPHKEVPEDRVHTDQLGYLLRQKPLSVLNTGSFLLHMTLTVIFVILPFRFRERLGAEGLWKVVVPVVILGLIVMAVLARQADRRGWTDQVFYLGGGVFLGSCLLFAGFGKGTLGPAVALLVFVLAVACLEPALPSLTTRFAVGTHRGAAMGVFHMSQFLGSFTGGFLGGAFLKADQRPLFLGIAGLVLLWLLAARLVGGVDPRPAASGKIRTL